MNSKFRTIAIHLPQFHPIPENDSWWGKGFTEWTNVKKAKPLFEDHYQPHVPFNNNYYDLRDIQNLFWQKELAEENGIYGFCFYHYWFDGKLLLERPLEMILHEKKWDFPFCLCWANENWTRRWDGKEQEVLMQQVHTNEDDLLHIRYLLKFFKDERYIKVDGKPVMLIYRSELFPDITRTLNIWRNEVISNGLKGLFLINVESFSKNQDPGPFGFDAAMDFQPDWRSVPGRIKGPLMKRIYKLLTNNYHKSIYHHNQIYSYRKYVDLQIKNDTREGYKRFPCLFPGWDNSARRKTGANIFAGSTPEIYGKWLNHVLNNFKPYSEDENFIFINAWNEWAEGNHLEPCNKWGHAYLEKTREILKAHNQVESNKVL